MRVMPVMKRNLRPVYACMYMGEEDIVDANGYKTGEKRIAYSEPVYTPCNVSAEKGQVIEELFGNLEDYDRVLIPGKDYGIDEHTVLFVDKEPEFDDFGNPVYDYVVKRVGRSLNVIAIAAKKVKR